VWKQYAAGGRLVPGTGKFRSGLTAVWNKTHIIIIENNIKDKMSLDLQEQPYAMILSTKASL